MTDERRQTVILARTFFTRLFESDMMPQGLPQVQLLISVFAFLAAPSLILPLYLVKKYIWPLPELTLRASMAGDRTLALLLAMTATAVITLAIWENIFPDRRDSRTLGMLPIRPRSFVLARLYAIVTIFAILFLGTTAISSFTFGVLGAVAGLPEGFLRVASGHFLAVAGAQAFVFFGILAVQCVLMNITGARAAQRAAVVLQVLLIVAVLQMPMLLPSRPDYMVLDTGSPGWLRRPAASLLPPLWFLSLYQAVVGLPYAGAGHLAAVALGLATATPLLALVFYAASYGRLTRLAIEGGPVPRSSRVPLGSRVVAAANRLLAPAPVSAAVCGFTIRTLVRSRQHRMLMAIWAGVALALTISTLLPAFVRLGWVAIDRPRASLLAGPLICTALIQTGMRTLFAIPVEIRANWIVRLREPVHLRDALSGATAALLACSVVPAVLLAFVTASALWGIVTGLQHAFYCGLLGTALAQVLMRGTDKMPFTCTYTPGTAQIGKFWPLYLTLFSFFTYGMAGLEEALLPHAPAYLIAIALLGLIAAALWWLRLREARQFVNLRFESEPLDGVTVLSV